jgi:hypothetical protein
MYGTLIPTWTARVVQQATAPFAMVAWIGDSHLAHDKPSMTRVVPTCDAGHTAIGVRVVTGQRIAAFLLQPGQATSHTAGECVMLAYQTDARVMHYLEAGDNLVRLDLVGASHARTSRDGWLSIAASGTMEDLHVTMQEGVLDLRSARPSPQLRVQGDAVRGAIAVHLNHREFHRPTADRTDTLVLNGVDWGEPLADT